MKTYVIREVATKKMVSCWEGEDGKQRAAELVMAHNAHFPVSKHYFVSEEVL